eukprot:s117_g18.t3
MAVGGCPICCVHRQAGGAFEKALSRLSSAPKLSTDWHLKEAVSAVGAERFRDWAAPGLGLCDPGADRRPHYGPGPSPGCGWLRCLQTGPPFVSSMTKLCGMHRLAAPGPETRGEGGICLQNTSSRICGVDVASGNVGCYSEDACKDPSPVAPKLACFPDGHSAVHVSEVVANMSHFGSGNSIGAWNDEPKMVNRWNTLIRLVAKRRRMQDVFQVYDAMRALWVRADHGTTEFIARAAVATVDLSGLVDSFHTMPPARYPEVVFVGWSNVGKSSLINSLLHRTAVAPVSTMPGKTTQFHFYTINERNAAFPKMTLVDVPGIGEAMADEVQTRHWRRTLDLYLKERGPTLRQVFHLISCEVLLRRQKPSPLDISVMEMCLHHRSKFNLDYTLVITKIDLIRSKKDAETVYENLCKVVRRLRLGSAKIVPASVRSTTGRVLLWKRLWRSVDPENSVWHSSQDLSALRQEVERLVEAKDAEALIKRAKEESGDGWECIVRGILALGRLHDAWHIIQAGPQRAQGLEEQETAEDAMENDMEMLKEGLLEAAEAGEEAAEDEDEEDAQEVSEEEAGADFFAIPEDLESEQMAAMQERAALAVGEAALAPTSDAGNETLLAPRDPALAEEVAKMLSKEHRGAAAELLMEQVVASARLESLDSGFARSFGKLEALLKQAKEDAIFTPWSADRWNRLLRVVGSQGNLPAVERVLDYMSQFQVTGDQETDAVMAELVVSSVDLGGQALGPCELEEGNPGSAAPKVLLLGGRGFSSRKGGVSASESCSNRHHMLSTGSLQIHGSLVSLRMDAMNGQMGGKTKPGAPPCARVFVKNLPGGSTDDSVRAIFEKFANVQGVKVLAPSMGRTTLAGYVTFASVDEATWVVENISDHPLDGLPEPVSISFAYEPDSVKGISKGYMGKGSMMMGKGMMKGGPYGKVGGYKGSYKGGPMDYKGGMGKGSGYDDYGDYGGYGGYGSYGGYSSYSDYSGGYGPKGGGMSGMKGPGMKGPGMAKGGMGPMPGTMKGMSKGMSWGKGY